MSEAANDDVIVTLTRPRNERVFVIERLPTGGQRVSAMAVVVVEIMEAANADCFD